MLILNRSNIIFKFPLYLIYESFLNYLPSKLGLIFIINILTWGSNIFPVIAEHSAKDLQPSKTENSELGVIPLFPDANLQSGVLNSIQTDISDNFNQDWQLSKIENIHFDIISLSPDSNPRSRVLNSIQTNSENSHPEVTPPLSAISPRVPQKPVNDGIALDSVQLDSSYLTDNFNLVIYSLEPTFTFRLDNNNKLTLKSGFTHLEGQAGFKPVTIYPVRWGWEGRINQKVTLRAGTTLNCFDRLPSSLGVDAGVNIQVLPNLNLGASFERSPMKYAPSTLEIPEKTTFSSYGVNLYWQIDRDTSLASFFNLLEYNDGNQSQLSYTKLKHNFGQFSIAANLVTSSFERDAAPFYFAPPDYLIYNGEIGWQGDITENLNLRLQLNLGEQRVQGEFSRALYYEAQLTAKLSSNVNAFIKYTYGELDQVTYFRERGGSPDDLYNQTTVTAQILFKF